MGPVKLVISDIDGTLLTSDRIVTPGTVEAIQRVTRRGVHFAVATGRPTRGLRETLAGIDLVLPTIGSNGAVVEDLTTGEVFHSAHMDHEIARRVVAVARECNLGWVVYDTSRGWVAEVRGGRDDGTLRHFLDEDEVLIVDDLATAVPADSTITKIAVHGDEAILVRLDHALRSVTGVRCTTSGENNREIVLAGVDKARAAQMLADRLDLTADQVLAIGDSGNDLELIAWAGIGVAMGNAIPAIKEVANWVTSSNDEDGVARALARFVL